MNRNTHTRAAALVLACALELALTGCASLPEPHSSGAAQAAWSAALAPSSASSASSASTRLAEAAPPPATPATPAATPAPPAEPRFDLMVNGASARDVFLSLVADTRYSMLMHPQVEGTMSVTLRGVTVREALESIRDVYGYDFRIEGRRISIYPHTLQTRIFAVNYLHARRQGSSEVRVSGSGAPNTSSNANGASQTRAAPDSSHITTTSLSDYWSETTEALRSLLGKGEGRQVIASPHGGTIAVRAMPDELRQVELFLRASRLSIERQVMLEAKIVEVDLREGFQSGIDWSVLGNTAAFGQTSGYPRNPLLGNTRGLPTLGAAVGALADGVGLPTGAGGTLGLALATKGFEAVLGFLESQGDLQILSSPRVATLNNQKAVLKVGVDEYFVTNVSGGSVAAGSGNGNLATTALPTLTLTPFFSGIALDVTPQIDDAGMITLHLRPTVTSVSEKTKQIDLGAVGNYRLPLATSSVNETDTVVRVTDGHIVAIGGLMHVEMSQRSAGLPGRGDSALARLLLGNNASSQRKKELVVLIRPTIIRSAEEWQRQSEQAAAALAQAAPDAQAPGAPRRVITLGEPAAVALRP